MARILSVAPAETAALNSGHLVWVGDGEVASHTHHATPSHQPRYLRHLCLHDPDRSPSGQPHRQGGRSQRDRPPPRPQRQFRQRLIPPPSTTTLVAVCPDPSRPACCPGTSKPVAVIYGIARSPPTHTGDATSCAFVSHSTLPWNPASRADRVRTRDNGEAARGFVAAVASAAPRGTSSLSQPQNPSVPPRLPATRSRKPDTASDYSDGLAPIGRNRKESRPPEWRLQNPCRSRPRKDRSRIHNSRPRHRQDRDSPLDSVAILEQRVQSIASP